VPLDLKHLSIQRQFLFHGITCLSAAHGWQHQKNSARDWQEKSHGSLNPLGTKR
jgi:hypothetical protein